MALDYALMDAHDGEGVERTQESRRREEKHNRFVRVAAHRTQQVLDRLRLLAKCANRAVYQYNDDEVRRIFEAIEEEVAEARRGFENRARQRTKFEL